MQVELDLQLACENAEGLPTEQKILHWVTFALATAGYKDDAAELTVRIVDAAEITELNKTYRYKDYATNVLSFPFEAPENVQLPLLGDIVVCKQVMESEAQLQNKALEQHWAHLIVHGTLHLLGFDHIEETEAKQMETLEVQILNKLGIDDPYQDHQ